MQAVTNIHAVFDQPLAGVWVGEISPDTKNLAKLKKMLDEKRELTHEVAIESIGVLGDNQLLKSYYSASSKEVKYRQALESVTQAVGRALHKVYMAIVNAIRRAAEWIKQLFGRKNAPTRERVKKVADEAKKAKDAASDMRQGEVKSVLQTDEGKALTEKFVKGLSELEFATYADRSYEQQIDEIVKFLHHSKVLEELKRVINQAFDWFGKSNETKDGTDANLDKIHEIGMQTEEFEKIAELVHAVEEKRESLPEPKVTSQMSDPAAFVANISAALMRFQIKEVGSIIDDWNHELYELNRRVEREIVEIEKMRENPGGTNDISTEYLNVLGALPARIGVVMKGIHAVNQYYDALASLFFRALRYAESVADATYKETGDEKYAEAKSAMGESLSRLQAI